MSSVTIDVTAPEFWTPYSAVWDGSKWVPAEYYRADVGLTFLSDHSLFADQPTAKIVQIKFSGRSGGSESNEYWDEQIPFRKVKVYIRPMDRISTTPDQTTPIFYSDETIDIPGGIAVSQLDTMGFTCFGTFYGPEGNITKIELVIDGYVVNFWAGYNNTEELTP